MFEPDANKRCSTTGVHAMHLSAVNCSLLFSKFSKVHSSSFHRTDGSAEVYSKALRNREMQRE